MLNNCVFCTLINIILCKKHDVAKMVFIETII